MDNLKCPMCRGEEFEEIVVDGARWVYAKGLFKGIAKLISGTVKQHIKSYRCLNCENVQSFARK